MSKIPTGPRIYNIFPRIAGTMTEWRMHALRAKHMGFNWICLNPFHYPGFSGSLYSPKDHFALNPMFIDNNSQYDPMDQLRNFLKYCKSLNLLVMMDLVINHTAIDHPLLEDHKDWYKLDENGDVMRPSTVDGMNKVVWGDLAELNNEDSPDRGNLWAYWWDLVEFYQEVGFDGFRCDAAYKVPDNLWRFLIARAKENKPTTRFFAESLGCEVKEIIRLAKVGFDYTFNSSKWWDFEADWCLNQYNEAYLFTRSISFPETHDTPRLAADLDKDILAIKQKVLFSAIFSSGYMIPIGFEYGFLKRLDAAKTKPKDWEKKNMDLTEYISSINSMKRKYKILNEDCETKPVISNNAKILTLMKYSKDRKEKVLIILNKDLKNYQTFETSNIYELFDTKTPIIDISIEYLMDYLPPNFKYDLQPGQIKILYLHEVSI